LTLENKTRYIVGDVKYMIAEALCRSKRTSSTRPKSGIISPLFTFVTTRRCAPRAPSAYKCCPVYPFGISRSK